MHDHKKRASYDVEENKNIVLDLIKIENERTEQLSFENYDLEISCRDLKKEVRSEFIK